MGASLTAHHLLAAGLVPLGIVAAAVGIIRSEDADDLRTQALSQQYLAAREEAAALNASLEAKFAQLTHLRSQLTTLTTLTATARHTIAEYPDLETTFVILPGGGVHIYEDRRPAIPPIPQRAMADVLDTAAAPQIIGPTAFGPSSSSPSVVVTVPWRPAVPQAGVLGLRFDLANDLGLRTLAYPAAHRDTERCLHVGVRVLRVGTNTDGSTRLSSVKYCTPPTSAVGLWLNNLFPVVPVTAFVPIGKTGWVLERTTPARHIFAPFRLSQTMLGIAIFSVLLLSAGMAWWLFNLLMQPLRELHRLTALTEPGSRPPPATEIVALTAAFRHSLIHLRRRIRLVTHARDQASQIAEHATLTADLFPDLAGLIGPDYCFIHVNKPHEALFGRSAHDIAGRPVCELWGADSYAAMAPSLRQALSGHAATFIMQFGPPHAERWLETTYQPVLHSDTGAVRAVHFRVRDLTAERRQALRLQREVHTDTLTGLLNRRGFDFHLGRALARSSAESNAITLMYIDLDRFKDVNDTYGHAIGDVLLQTFAQRLTHALRSTDAVGRLGGDEFVVLIEGNEPAYVERVAEAVLACARLSFNLREHWIDIAASIGVASSERGHSSMQQLYEEADAALYCAKRAGKDCFRHFGRAVAA
jgi:diguanylate cyclase (GGDEF)-like protein